MNNFFRFSLPYAETHYKFKLPWSPLHKKWPEVFVDGPSFCIPGIKPEFYLIIKDADYFPVKNVQLDFLLQGENDSKKITYAQNQLIEKNLIFIPLALDFSGFTGKVIINVKITLENSSGKTKTFLNTNFPGVTSTQLIIQLLDHPLPYLPNWHAGELHCHTDYSNDPVEFGAPLNVFQKAGQALGLGFVLTTDHSYDFYYNKTRYMQPVNPETNFLNYRNEALRLNNHSDISLPVMVPGEEVSCGNAQGENVHLLVAGFESFIHGHGDGGRRWLNNKPDLSIEQVLKIIGDTPCFAAHPQVRVGALERLIFRRGRWSDADLFSSVEMRGVNGVQFWNGTRSQDFHDGKAQWIRQLLSGKKLSPIGANDAHGDLNQNIGVKTPLFSLYQNRKHVFGHVRTVVYSEEKSLRGIQKGLGMGPASEQLFSTDGPFLNHKIANQKLEIQAKTNSDFGTFSVIRIFAGTTGTQSEKLIKEWKWNNEGPENFSESIEFQKGLNYLRAEAKTNKERFALTTPVYF